MIMRERLTWENSLRVGAAVDVWWGYGSGFRAKGRGVIDAIFPKSFRVRLTEAASGASCRTDGIRTCVWNRSSRVDTRRRGRATTR